MSDNDSLAAIEMIRNSARGIVPPNDLTRVRALRHRDPGFDRAVWAEMCAQGWPAVRRSEDDGGVGLEMPAYVALAEELGRGLVPEPLIPAILAAALLDGPELEAQLGGTRLVIPAWADGRGATGPDRPLRIENGRVSGEKVSVPCATGADAFLLIGTNSAALVENGAPGLHLDPYALQDGGFAATLRCDGVACTVLPADPTPALAEAALATAGYLLGVMETALKMTVGYLKEREQFGTTIGHFQILQHMAVDMALEAAVTRASVEQAARQWESDGPADSARAAVSRAKARASSGALKLTRDAIQLHGGIGFTDEHNIGLCLRKAMVLAPAYGGAPQHRAQFARLKRLAEEV